MSWPQFLFWLASFPPIWWTCRNTRRRWHYCAICTIRAFELSELFWVNWFTPYLLGYLLVYVLTPLLGIVVCHPDLSVAVAIAAVPVATAVLAKETGADCYWGPVDGSGHIRLQLQVGDS